MIEIIKQKERQFPKLFEIIRFVITGVIATLIDMFVMALVMYFPCKQEFGSFINVFLLKEIAPVWLSVVGTSAGFLVSVVINYIFSLCFVYEGDNKNAKTKKGIILFFVLSVAGLGIQSVGMFLGCTLLKLNEFVIKIILICVVLVFNYITRKIFIFNQKNNAQAGEQKNNLSEQGANKKAQAGEQDIYLNNGLYNNVSKHKEKLTTSQAGGTYAKINGKVEIKENVQASEQDVNLNNNLSEHIDETNAELNKTSGKISGQAVDKTNDKFMKNKLVANAVAVLSGLGLFWAMVSGISNSTFNLILKLGCGAVWLAVMLLFVFIFNQSFCLNSFKSLLGKSRREIVVSVLSVLLTMMFVGYTIWQIEKSVLNIFAILLGVPILLIAFVRACQFVVGRVCDFAKSLTKTEILFAVLGFAVATILIVIADVKTVLFAKTAVGNLGNGFFEFNSRFYLNNDIFNNPFSAANNWAHAMLSFVILPFSLPFALLFYAIKLPVAYAVFAQLLQVVLLLALVIVLKRLFKIKILAVEIAFYLVAFLALACMFNVLICHNLVAGIFFCVLTINAVVKTDNAKYAYYLLASFGLTLNLVLLPFVVFKKGKSFKDMFKEAIVLAAIFVGIACLFGQINNLLDIVLKSVR